MKETSGIVVDKKFLLAMFIVCIAIGGGFAFVYLDLKGDFAVLKNDYVTLSDQMQQLQTLIESMHHEQVANLTAVEIYNRTKNSVVFITCSRGNGSIVEGSGFVYDAGGHIVTNNHVVENADSIVVKFFDGTSVQADLIGRDVYSDLAVIKVGSLPAEAYPLIVGDSTQLMVGEPVYAIGNPFGLSSSMTSGIVSQVGRVLRLSDLGVPLPQGKYAIIDVIQFDAAINPGNSGGPLLNSLGFVVGVTFAIETVEGIRGFIGIGYAVPSVLLKRVVPSIIEKGTYEHPWIGVQGLDMNAEIAEAMHTNYTTGFLITEVDEGGPAALAGLRGGNTDWVIRIGDSLIPLGGDIIIRIDEVYVKKSDDILTYIERYKSPLDEVTLTIVRDNKEENRTLTLGVRP